MRKTTNLVRIASVLTFTAAACSGCGGNSDNGTFSLSVNHMSFTAAGIYQPSDPSSQTVFGTVSGFKGDVLYLPVVISGDPVINVSNFLLTSNTNGQADISPIQGSAPGAHHTNVAVHACGDPNCGNTELAGSPANISVDYTVYGVGVPNDTALNYTIGNAPTVPDLTRQVPVTGYPDASFSTTSDDAWAHLTRTAGATAATLTVTVDAAQLSAFDNGTYTTHVQLVPPQGDTIILPVSVTINRTVARYVAPHVELTGSSAEVIIRGDNFDALALTGFHFGSIAATAFRVVSPSELRATHPAMAAGSYTVALDNAGNLGISFAVLTVVPPPSFTSSAIAYPSSPNRWVLNDMLYDAGRDALFLGLQNDDTTGNTSLRRYAHNSHGGWDSPTIATLNRFDSFGMSIDGRRFLGTADGALVNEYDPVTLTLLRADGDQGAYFDTWSSFGVTSDNYLVGAFNSPSASGFSNAIKFSIRNATLVANFDTGFKRNRGDNIGSLDGSTVLIGNSASPYNFGLYDSSTGVITELGIKSYYAVGMATDRIGSRFVVQNQYILDRAGNQLAALPDGMQAVAMTTDGSVVYALDQNHLLRTFELTAMPGGGISAVEVGTGTALSTDPGGFPIRMVITPDNGTLFIGGDQRVVIVPLAH